MLNETDLARADLNLLVLFDVVLRERHVGRAARALNLSPSAVSHGLGRLRRLFGDPLFLKTPKGVVPTARAADLAEPVADLLARARAVLAPVEPFDPSTASRRFVIGAPDGVSAVLAPPLLADLRRHAPLIDIAVRELLPRSAARTQAQSWETAFADLDARLMDVAVLPVSIAPARFATRTLYADDFAIALRADHPLAGRLTLEAFCATPQLIVSLTGDAFGFVDEALALEGRSRRIALTAPNFMLGLAMVAETDLIGAFPRRFLERHARRFGVQVVDAPLTLPRFEISAVALKGAFLQGDIAWLCDLLRASAA